LICDIKPIITGIGLVTPLGNTAAQTWDALLAGRYITDHASVPLEFRGEMSRVSQLGLRAGREAIASTGGAWDGRDCALIVGTSKGPVESWLSPSHRKQRVELPLHPNPLPKGAGTGMAPSRLSDVEIPSDFGLAENATDIAMTLGLTGPRLTVSAACASGLHALIRGAILIQSGEARRVLVVAAEASVHPLFLASFARLGVLPGDGIGCRPFDLSRDGFLMSEAAAAVCLEANEGGRGGILIDRFALGADASHLTAGDTEGLSLSRVIEGVIGNDPIDFIHAHGTGTVANDPMELMAIERTLAEKSPEPPSLYSHKGALGHSLGAAGLVSVVINVMCHRRGMIPPNVRTTLPLTMTWVQMKQAITRRAISKSIALAAGFGGALAAVSLASRE
jgi:3-oxoacyl-[acyl-carrier-protein] synthase II